MRLFAVILLGSIVCFAALASAADTCVEKTDFPVFKVFESYEAERYSKSFAIQTMCEELEVEDMHRARTVLGHVAEPIDNLFFYGITGGGAAAFAKLDGTPEGRTYVAELNRIKKIAIPIERIKRTYELAREASGDYDYDSMARKTMLSGWFLGTEHPANLFANKKKRGTIGICNEFAGLLYWSLLQVMRWSGSTSMALGPNDFSASKEVGIVARAGKFDSSTRHAWVRINLPRFEGSRLVGFTRFDLDSTWNETFTPLFPRRSGVTGATRAKAIEQCHRIATCYFSRGW